MQKIIRIAIITTLAAFALTPVQAQAAATIQAAPLTNLSVTDATVQISITNFPVRGGLYIQQCNEPVAGARPTACNPAAQLWISNMPGASFAPTAQINFKPKSSYVSAGNTIDCTTTKCGVFVRYDHTVTSDVNAEDQFIALSFGGAVQPTLQTQSLTKKSIPSTLKLKRSIVLPVKTSVGQKVKYTATGSCSLKGTTLRAKGAGTCTLTATAAAKADMYSAFEASYQIIVK
jgi:roadblock/LC7 domain-containing protein